MWVQIPLGSPLQPGQLDKRGIMVGAIERTKHMIALVIIFVIGLLIYWNISTEEWITKICNGRITIKSTRPMTRYEIEYYTVIYANEPRQTVYMEELPTIPLPPSVWS